MRKGKYGVLDDLVHTLLLPSVQEGHLCMDWADTKSVTREEGLGEIYWESGNNIEEAALKICDRLAAYQPEGRTIKAALFVLPSRVGFMETVFRPAHEILRRKVPKNATQIFAAPYVQATQDYRIGAFVIYGCPDTPTIRKECATPPSHFNYLRALSCSLQNHYSRGGGDVAWR